jgi:FAD/FMN-containing dehydrogenase
VAVDETYLEDASGFRGHADRLFIPDTAREIAQILAEANTANVPVTIAGAGTGLAGGRVPQGGWLISTEKLRKLEIHPGRAVVGAGVALKDLHAAAAASGQFYAPDPTETTASIGGTIACNASGSRSFRYGATRRHILSLEVAFMDGSLRRFDRGEKIDFEIPQLPKPAVTKNTAGYQLTEEMDWIDLITGSEGTLGVVTEAELQLLPVPKELLSGVLFFNEEAKAIAAVDAWRGITGLRMLEFFDQASLRLLGQKAAAALLYEQEIEGDSEEEIDRWIERLEAAEANADASWFASNAADRERFRGFRHKLPEQVNATWRKNGFTKLSTDYAVPLNKTAEMMRLYHQYLDQQFEGEYVIFGHIGDAHVHINLLPKTQEKFDQGKHVLFELAKEVVAMGGTVSAEHGLGKRKTALLEILYNPAQLEAMQSIKNRLDPNWLLGQGNVFPYRCESGARL